MEFPKNSGSIILELATSIHTCHLLHREPKLIMHAAASQDMAPLLHPSSSLWQDPSHPFRCLLALLARAQGPCEGAFSAFGRSGLAPGIAPLGHHPQPLPCQQ
ncbi:hypothetical protein WJX84_008340 [Apatococcus fuscideae]|uniref:Uncharacterized protein n=1 Tax=Apatococcus fuscideae TaxID=2026836 RepID=A0AAW1SYW7_9CHLO